LLRSDGDLRCRCLDGGSYIAAYWDREEFRFAGVSPPKGLAIDAAGAFSGLPLEPGESEVSLKIEDRFGKSRVFSRRPAVASWPSRMAVIRRRSFRQTPPAPAEAAGTGLCLSGRRSTMERFGLR
jgi:hypothetical protein